MQQQQVRQPKQPPRWANKKRVAEYIGRSTDAVQHLKRRGILKAYNVDRRLMFDLNEVDRALKKGRR